MKIPYKQIVTWALIIMAGYVFLNFEFFSKTVGFALKEEPMAVVTPTPTAEKMEPDSLIIPSLGISAPVIYASEVDEKKFQELLQKGVVHYPNTVVFGKPGNAYVFGHSSDYPWARGEYKTVFALLPNIKIGDEIMVSDQEGFIYKYKVRETQVVSNNDKSILNNQDKANIWLTLQTSYPVGTALKRFLVISELIQD